MGVVKILKEAKQLKAELDDLYPGRRPEETEQILLSFIVEHNLGEELLNVFRSPQDSAP